jgi:hypothetical protein
MLGLEFLGLQHARVGIFRLGMLGLQDARFGTILRVEF